MDEDSEVGVALHLRSSYIWQVFCFMVLNMIGS